MKVLLVFATSAEAEILKRISGLKTEGDRLEYGGSLFHVLVTGVGGISTAWSMQKWMCNFPKPDLAINAGIAGSFTERFVKGDVVLPVSDCFADMGIESDGNYSTLAEAGLMNPDEYPFSGGIILCDNDYFRKTGSFIPAAKAVTVNTASGSEAAIRRIKNKFNPDIETMEGATFFYVCAREKIPFLALRAISNYVEPGRRSKWDIPLALENLAGKVAEVMKILF